MKRIRLSTLMLLVVIAAQTLALVVQSQRAARREAELLAQLPLRPNWPYLWKLTPQEAAQFWSPEDVVIGDGR